MKCLLLGFMVMFFGFETASDTPQPSQHERLILRAKEAVQRSAFVQVGERGFCSGVIVETGKVLTAKHCVSQEGTYFVNGKPAEILRVSPIYDLMLLKTETPKMSKVRIAKPYLMDEVIMVWSWASEHPMLDIVSSGHICHISETMVATDVHGAPGFSGSGLYSADGLVAIQTQYASHISPVTAGGGQVVAMSLDIILVCGEPAPHVREFLENKDA